MKTSLSPRQFGVEIEVSRRLVCVNYTDRRYNHIWDELISELHRLQEIKKLEPGWKMKTDTSCGGEAVSPPMIGNDGLRQVAIVCDLIRKTAETYGKPAVDGECGLHIHIDAGNMTPRHLSRLFSLVHMSEPIIFAMYPGRNFDYCAPIDVNMRQASRFRDWVDVRDVWYRGSNNVRHKDMVYQESFINSTKPGEHYDGTRYHGFNIHCYWRLNTVEFRYGRGTIDPLHIKAYYEMCLAMVNTAMSDEKIVIPDTIKKKKYYDLQNFYSSNYRFRKFIKRLAKMCNFSRGTIKLILSRIRENEPKFLAKPPIECGEKEKKSVDELMNQYSAIIGDTPLINVAADEIHEAGGEEI